LKRCRPGHLAVDARRVAAPGRCEHDRRLLERRCRLARFGECRTDVARRRRNGRRGTGQKEDPERRDDDDHDPDDDEKLDQREAGVAS
jgi:hypothetical protein